MQSTSPGPILAFAVLSCLLSLAALAANPAEKFDLRSWKINLPVDQDNNGKADEIDVKELASFSHPDFFYLNENGFMVMTAPNRGTTTVTSTNTRSELRQMHRQTNTEIDTKSPQNNFALEAHRDSRAFAAVGGQLEASLRVLHVAKRAKHPNKKPAFSVVVGQIHADSNEDIIQQGEGFGWGNEPIKIYYKKWPEHDRGSVFWTYERNLPKTDPNRTDIAYPVWGNTWENPEDPGHQGIALDQAFNYSIKVQGNVMHLKFSTTDPSQTVTYRVDLSDNVDPYGNVDEKDNPKGYSGDTLYFKLGTYNQCSTKDKPGMWFPGCAGTGDWEVDKASGDYASAAFSRIQLK